MAWLYVIVPAVFVYIVYKLRRSRRKIAKWHSTGAVVSHKTFIITGANCGIGFEAASELVGLGARVILACRDDRKAEEARARIITRWTAAASDSQNASENVSQRCVVRNLDLSDFASVRRFAADILRTESRLDCLVNNAGVANLSRRTLTKDGLETTLQTNHFGPFLLTNLLLPLLQRSAPARIVVVSSALYRQGKLDLTDLNYERRSYPGGMIAYRDSKLANVLFTLRLAQILQGSGVTVNALHPGVVNTQLFRHVPLGTGWLMRLIGRAFFRTPTEGAQTVLHLAASQEPSVTQANGLYFGDCRVEEVEPVGRDVAVATKLYEISERLTGLV